MNKDYYIHRYGNYNDIGLPKTYRTYFDAFCHEYSTYSADQKLLDIAYAITHGFDIKMTIKTVLDTHPHVSEAAIHRAILDLTAAVNNVDSSYYNRRNPIDVDIEIFIEDLMRRYRLPLDGSILHYLDDDFRHVGDMDVFACNGWELASKDINNYQMFKDNDFVEYPGDHWIIQKYHQEGIDTGNVEQIFPAGPIPEPWYGNPMTSKIIILGSMPEYDDFVTRCSNIVMSFEPRLMEEVQCMVRNWMCLSGIGIYCEGDFRQSGIGCCDAYNSPTYRHWVSELRYLAWETGIEEHLLLNNTCVINANAYYSEYGSDPLAAGLLPSQYYLRLLINYLVNNRTEQPLFIIPSAPLHKVWKKVLGYWIENELMLMQDKIIVNSSNTKLKLTKDLLGKRNIKNIQERL